MRMEQMYQEVILDHYKHPHGRGLRDPYDAEVHHVNPTCGDEVTLRVSVVDDAVADISYDGQGCSISQASTSVLYDQVVGLPVDEALATVDSFNAMMTSRGTDPGDEEVIGDGIALAGVSKYPARVKCALLGWMAFKDALSQSLATEVPDPA
ncbi:MULTISPECIES: Fe-S cluster assembly sulfur transfer protein SufU [Gordonia]|uniref:Iron-sulfur cluster assembly protein IscU n=2 Tax=Gordonia TaxID=2053 RepID=L7LFV0_9ACTN|nr:MULTISPECIES: SUF system NifU family Fe-S cluster assembly protein [Gordonia]AUH69063.1 SUF system NifU family Fe-S cluster assembly protein [Gordonia sp. YC-JH1]KJR06587.1 nitrogen fixation protein NifU [Gordonia sihwensis]KXT56838.1 nitrogen fixation protein NifU [Gordonia sp. QH-12]MBY4568610.1 iron-sulfur cluster assembly scaffold protein NifU [Gordonia sihwensis]GAC59616.1 iron-sulfur cluster assembly protein IscU [Gordonia sihwensis NBRC 108236]